MPDWYLTIRAAEKLNMSAPDLDALPDGEYWLSRALAAIRAEVGAQKTIEQARAGKSRGGKR